MREVQIVSWDDLDYRGGMRTPADETVTLGIDGVWYEIDLSADHAEQLRKLLDPYTETGRRPEKAPRARARPRPESTGRPRGRHSTVNAGIRAFCEDSRNAIPWDWWHTPSGFVLYKKAARQRYAEHLTGAA